MGSGEPSPIRMPATLCAGLSNIVQLPINEMAGKKHELVRPHVIVNLPSGEYCYHGTVWQPKKQSLAERRPNRLLSVRETAIYSGIIFVGFHASTIKNFPIIERETRQFGFTNGQWNGKMKRETTQLRQ